MSFSHYFEHWFEFTLTLEVTISRSIVHTLIEHLAFLQSNAEDFRSSEIRKTNVLDGDRDVYVISTFCSMLEMKSLFSAFLYVLKVNKA